MGSDRPIRRVLDSLESVEGENGRYKARCPAHDDRRPSLTVEEVGENGGRKVLLKCWAGCKKEDIIAKLGLEWSALFSENGSEASRRRIVATYDYTYPMGELVYQVVRFEPKGFSQRRTDGEGNWIWNLEGIEPVLYRLPEVMRAVLSGEMVLLCEGEKDVDNARERLEPVW